MDPHIFNCTLSFNITDGTVIKVVSDDQSIQTTIPITNELLGLFEAGQYKIRCTGYWDNKEHLVWLGEKLDS